MYSLLADFTVVVHFAFVAFVVAGGFLVLRWPWVAWLHIPAAVWGALVEFTGWFCPLTPLENRFRSLSGGTAYETGFIEHYLLPVLYPEYLDVGTQVVFGTLVLLINGCIYCFVWKKRQHRRRRLS